MGKQKRVADGQLEAAVMEVLWHRGGWVTPGEVHDVLAAQRPLAYNTVLTILVRLCRKGRVDRQRDGRAHAYHPVHSREEHAAALMERVLHHATDRPAALASFVETLGAADRAQLRRLLDQLRRKG
ncbi:MAG: BlaI/MecI/CopY family transcriptional regulator [Acidimicrobiales bacterium]